VTVVGVADTDAVRTKTAGVVAIHLTTDDGAAPPAALVAGTAVGIAVTEVIGATGATGAIAVA
jgi:hypothetical protein